MAKARDIIIGVVIGGSFLLFFGMIIAFVMLGRGGSSDGLPSFGKKVAIINIYGVIESSTDIVRQLDRWADDNSVQAILLHINSPGGGVTPSQEIYEKILKVKAETKKPIVASMSSVCASGGYYIACAADRIVANQGTITGSIGVIFQYPVIEEMFNKVGIKYQTIKSGGRKDVGSPFRAPTEADSTMLQAVVDDTYDQFVQAIVDNRDMGRDEVISMADGSVYSGRQAYRLGLVDTLGTFEDALDIAGEMCGLGKDPDSVREIPRRRASLWDLVEGLLNLDLSGLLARGDNLIYPQLRYIFN